MSTSEDTLDPGTAFLMAAFEPENRANPYPLYREMREQAAIIGGDLNIWFTFTHAAAHSLLRAKNTSSDERRSNEFQANVGHDPRYQKHAEAEPLMLFMDPPDHTRLRALVSSAFTPRVIEDLVPRIQQRADRLLDDIAAAGSGPVDLIEHLARPLPVGIICEMLGVPETDVNRFMSWSDDLTRSLDPGVLRTEADELMIERAEQELTAYTADLLQDRRKNPGDDLVSALLAVRDGEDRLTEPELINLIVLLLVAGHETTVNLIGNGLVALLDNPDELTRWQGDPSLDKNAVDEILRFDSPVQMGMRVMLEATEIEGVTIPAGDQVICFLGAANRDPAVFEDPDRLNLSRPNAARNMSFGGGVHHCLGMALARVEGQVALGSLLRRFNSFELAAPPPIRPRFVLRGFDSVMVNVSS